MRSRPIAAAVAVALMGVAVAACGREESGGDGDSSVRGVTADTIKIGGSFPFTGPLASAGALSKGAGTAFEAANADGGVNGRKISYTALDDAYDPSRFAANVRRLVQRDRVFALITGLGPGITVRPFVQQEKTPQFNYSGLSGLSDIDQFGYTRGWWPDSSAESAMVTKHILDDDPNAKIGTLMLNNDLGVDMTKGVKRALEGNEGALVKETKFDVTQLDVTSQVNQLRSAGVTAVVTCATGNTAIQMIKYIKQTGWDAKVFLYSGSTSTKAILAKAGLQNAKGLYSALWLKDPSDPQWADDPGMQQYRKDVEQYGNGADPEDLYTANGYVGAEALLAVLKSVKDPTPEALLKGVDSFAPQEASLLAPGIELKAGKNGRLIHQYQVVRFDGKSWKAVGEPVDTEAAGLE
jgi:branched-chain amino acid transport system substrate-binding protein